MMIELCYDKNTNSLERYGHLKNTLTILIGFLDSPKFYQARPEIITNNKLVLDNYKKIITENNIPLQDYDTTNNYIFIIDIPNIHRITKSNISYCINYIENFIKQTNLINFPLLNHYEILYVGMSGR